MIAITARTPMTTRGGGAFRDPPASGGGVASIAERDTGGSVSWPVSATVSSTGAAAPVATLRSDAEDASPSSAASAARAKSPAEGKRSAGSLESARATTRSSSAGTSARNTRSRGGSSRMCAYIFSILSSRAPNGGLPVTSSNRTQASE